MGVSTGQNAPDPRPRPHQLGCHSIDANHHPHPSPGTEFEQLNATSGILVTLAGTATMADACGRIYLADKE
ncbi:MAG: hypothetical protein P8J87_13585 [Verrucomicrobiales bacterium]|nr:hypothetical protein [Verrucomicrobiales bacterium]